jgi:hypothetical protein
MGTNEREDEVLERTDARDASFHDGNAGAGAGDDALEEQEHLGLQQASPAGDLPRPTSWRLASDTETYNGKNQRGVLSFS